MNIYLSILIIFLLRVFGAIVDANSLRPDGVGWWPWHELNWMRRDIVIVIMYIEQAVLYIRRQNSFTKSFDRRFYAVLFFIPFIGVNYLLHQIFYNLGIWLQPYLDWGF